MDKSAWTVGNWNAYVVQGDTFEERKRRLAEVPDKWRASVKRHAQTVRAIREFQNRRAREKAEKYKQKRPHKEKDNAVWHYGD